MIYASLLAKGRYCGLFVLYGANAAAWAGGCTAPQLSAQIGVVDSRWQEFNAQGQRVVSESGILHSTGLRLQGDCAGLQWAAQWSQARGTRDYDGVSSTGAAIQTHSALRQTQAQLELWAPVADALALGVRLGWTQVDRDLAGVGTVLGYPEQFRYLQAALGARYTVLQAAGVRLGLQAWVGGGPGGRSRLQLPNADAARLTLGSSQLAQLALQLESTAARAGAPGWNWQVRLQLQQEQMRAGPGQAITRNGLVVGGAAQPKTRQSATGLEAGLQYSF